MTGYTCKYTPSELLAGLSAQPALLNGEAKDFQWAEGLTHSNLCCHAKALIEQGAGLKELVLVNCCDSVRRAYDSLAAAKEDEDFLFLMDLPHTDGPCARRRLKAELLRLHREYAAYKGTDFDREAFLLACQGQDFHAPDRPFLAVLGARVSRELFDAIQGRMDLPVVDLTCGNHRRIPPFPEDARTLSFDALMDWYAGALLCQIPCMRMVDMGRRRELYENENLRGVIYNTVKFCDFYSFEYGELKQELSLPILKIESDFTPQAAGQLATRLDAFSESLWARETQEKGIEGGHNGLKGKNGRITMRNGKGQGLYGGIDSGSTTTNMVVINDKREIVASAIVRTGAKAERGAANAFEEIRNKLGISESDFEAITATGYGRNSIAFATDSRTEITCHAKGAHFLNPVVRTIVDIGGQDSKVICLDESGAVANFVMNDKCAAGTGRFLEMMARTLEMDLARMSREGLAWKRDLTISSMCTVFAESEVISLIADNQTAADIVHGLNKAIASKTASMVSRSGGGGPFMMTGGVARNQGVVKELEKKLAAPLWIGENPDLCGALGAALFAAEFFSS